MFESLETFEEYLKKKYDSIKEDSANIVKENIEENKLQLLSEQTVEDDNAKKLLEEKLLTENFNGYKIFRDKQETFKCDLEITGASLDNSKARIIVECEDLTYMFEGTIDKNGKCNIPLKKINFLNENEKGNIRLEVIADDMVFNPWESPFMAVNSKKVSAKIAEPENTSPKVQFKVSNIN